MAGDKINIQKKKNLVFLQSRNERPENRIRKTTSFVITAGRTKYLGRNLTEEAQGLYTETTEHG